MTPGRDANGPAGGGASTGRQAKQPGQGGSAKFGGAHRSWEQGRSVVEHARALAAADRFADAAAALEPYLRSEPDDVQGHLVLAWTMIGRKQYDEAAAAMVALEPLAPRDAERLRLLAVASSLAERHQDAIAAVTALRELRPGDPAVRTLEQEIRSDAAHAAAPPPETPCWGWLARASLALWAVMFVTARIRLLVEGDVPTWGRLAGGVGALVTVVVWAVQLRPLATAIRELLAGLRRPVLATALLTHLVAVLALASTALSDTDQYPVEITVAIVAGGLSGLVVVGHFVRSRNRDSAP